MTLSFTYPGVYVHEMPSEVRTITGVATSITAFVGRTLRGPTDRAVLVQSVAEFGAIYGGLWEQSPLTYAVSQYFLNGGRDALICRVHKDAHTASVTLPAGFGLEAANEGAWGSKLRVRVEEAPHDAEDPPDSRFNLLVRDTDTGQTETFLNLSTMASHPRFVSKRPRRGISAGAHQGGGAGEGAGPKQYPRPASRRPVGRCLNIHAV